MGDNIKKIALLTGGGDCPGLNAAIRAITKTAILKFGYEVIGYMRGFSGLFNNDYIELNLDTVSGILRRGGSILYTSNRDNLFDFEIVSDDITLRQDVSDVAVDNLKKNNVDVLIVIGGDEALQNASRYEEKGIKIIGVPKTINNNIPGSDVTFGFNSALQVAVQALDRLHTTAASHHRVMILEVMGKKTGWIALEAGIAGSADVILIPEIPYDINKIVEKIEERKRDGKFFTIVVAAEGANPRECKNDELKIGGVGHRLADGLEEILSDQEVRCTVLGHTQRGGDASTYDRVLATRVGVRAVEFISDGLFGNMVSVRGNDIIPVPLKKVTDNTKLVNPEGELVNVARSTGIVFGD